MYRRFLRPLGWFAAAVLLASGVASAQMIGWRGDGTGVFPEARPVTEWSEGKNVVWKRAMPSWSNASPIVVRDRVIALAEPHTVLCLDAATGQRVWTGAKDQLDLLCRPHEADKIRRAWNPAKKSDGRPWAALEQKGLWRSTYGHCIGTTMATPVSDGTSVYVALGTHTVVCYRLTDGVCRWLRWFGPPPDPAKSKELYERFGPGHLLTRWPDTRFVPSPLLVGGRLVLQHGFAIRALDPATGTVLWEFDYVPYNYGCGTPAAMRLGETDVIVTCRGWVVRVADGRVLARGIGATMNGGGNSPFVNDAQDIVYMVDGSTGGANTSRTTSAVRLRLTATGEVRSEVLWTVPIASSEGSSLYDDGLVYLKSGSLTVLDALTGKVLRERGLRVPSGHPSLAVAGSHVFCFDGKGRAAVVETGSDGTAVGGGELEFGGAASERKTARRAVYAAWTEVAPGYGYGVMWASPFFAGDRMYLRSRTHLYCIGPTAGGQAGAEAPAPRGRPARRGH